jgi:hypothetical protein
MCDKQKSIPIIPVPFFLVLKILKGNTEEGERKNIGGSV